RRSAKGSSGRRRRLLAERKPGARGPPRAAASAFSVRRAAALPAVVTARRPPVRTNAAPVHATWGSPRALSYGLGVAVRAPTGAPSPRRAPGGSAVVRVPATPGRPVVSTGPSQFPT